MADDVLNRPVLTDEEEILAVVRGAMLDGRNWRMERMRWLIDNEVRDVVKRVLRQHDERIRAEAQPLGDALEHLIALVSPRGGKTQSAERYIARIDRIDAACSQARALLAAARQRLEGENG